MRFKNEGSLEFWCASCDRTVLADILPVLVQLYWCSLGGSARVWRRARRNTVRRLKAVRVANGK